MHLSGVHCTIRARLTISTEQIAAERIIYTDIQNKTQLQYVGH